MASIDELSELFQLRHMGAHIAQTFKGVAHGKRSSSVGYDTIQVTFDSLKESPAARIVAESLKRYFGYKGYSVTVRRDLLVEMYSDEYAYMSVGCSGSNRQFGYITITSKIEAPEGSAYVLVGSGIPLLKPVS